MAINLFDWIRALSWSIEIFLIIRTYIDPQFHTDLILTTIILKIFMDK